MKNYKKKIVKVIRVILIDIFVKFCYIKCFWFCMFSIVDIFVKEELL